MSDARACGGDAAAYVLGALEPGEAEAFRRHLASCIVCRDEVAAFEQVVETLPMAAPQYPVPKAVRRRVTSAVRAEPREVPAAARRRRWRPFLTGAALPRPALALGVVLAAALATVGGLELASGGPSGTRVIHATVTGLPGSAELRVAGGHAELIVRGLSQPPPGHVYEVWLVRGHRAPSPTTALFSVTSAGAGDVGVPGNLRGASEVLVTPEPAGGSQVPTHTPVITARLV